MNKVIYVPVSEEIGIQRDAYASAGPRASVSGMRKLWGKDCFILRCGRYIYKVPSEVYYYYSYNCYK